MMNEHALELGLTALGRTGEEPGWFGGHYGAAVLAAHFMTREFDLPKHVRIGIEKMVDHFIATYPDLFVPYENEQADPALLARLIDGLRANTARLSHSGHGNAYGFLALKALLERQDLLLPSIVNGFYNCLIASSEGKGARYWGLDDYSTFTLDQVTDIPPYQSFADLVERSLDECSKIYPGRTIDGKRYHFTGEVEHGLTHAQALIEYARLGYSELTQAGLGNHRIQMQLNRRIPIELIGDSEIVDPPFTSIFAPEYWSQTYDDPHCLKVPYAALFLLHRLPEAKRAEAERNVCKILCQMK
ncbi:hypothetical protein CIG75_01110 [Tumebacillus algifaecis]|uniref:Uncharacterized protein n=1 Tax=Tumebacillus algifaecis TaxID=1214604 RepID=A0A223CWQ3_9BACL|nr:hypothetical protein [Tumebacillus algifaecis]ASS73712.1 hypothetical protein CIG75_01110 [Tumebacillus algifaecis]